jgi:hypothetical protein
MTKVPVRNVRDLDHALKKMASMFNTEAVIVVGSQAVLLKWGNKAPDAMRTSGEIDMYPANKNVWEEAQRRIAGADAVYVEASEYIHQVAGEGSAFDEIHGFYIDGVDETTSPLPLGWQERALYRDVDLGDGRKVTGVSPAIEDTLAAKLIRLREKDAAFIEAAYFFQPFDIDDMKRRMNSIQPFASYTQEYLDGCRARAVQFLDAFKPMPAKNTFDHVAKMMVRLVPDYPQDTHCAFYNLADSSVTIRRWNADMGIFFEIDNPLGPAIISKGQQQHALDGVVMTKADWQEEVSRGVEPCETPPWRLPNPK